MLNKMLEVNVKYCDLIRYSKNQIKAINKLLDSSLIIKFVILGIIYPHDLEFPISKFEWIKGNNYIRQYNRFNNNEYRNYIFHKWFYATTYYKFIKLVKHIIQFNTYMFKNITEWIE
jgi:hypothetical protein